LCRRIKQVRVEARMGKDWLILKRNKGQCYILGLCYLDLDPEGVVKELPWRMERRKLVRNCQGSGPWRDKSKEQFRRDQEASLSFLLASGEA